MQKEKKELTSPILEISWEVSLIFKPPSFIFCSTKFCMFSTRSSSALHFFSAFSASGPVSATILRIPLEMASSETRTNNFMCPVRCRCLVRMSKRISLFVLRFIQRNTNQPITKALFSPPSTSKTKTIRHLSNAFIFPCLHLDWFVTATQP